MNNGIIVSILIMFSFDVLAETGTSTLLQKFKKSRPGKKPLWLLYDVNSNKGIPVQGKFKPNRVYLNYGEKDKKYFFVLTNFQGKVKKPLEHLRGDTVLPGKYLGAKNPKRHYLLTGQGVWVPTFQQERHYYWVFQNPPRIKTVGKIVVQGKTKTLLKEIKKKNPIKIPGPDVDLSLINVGGKERNIASEILPNRIYRVKTDNKRSSGFVLSNFDGKIPQPVELLLAGSVLPSQYVGGTKGVFYQLSKKQKWVLSDKREEYRFLVLGDEPHTKVIRFVDPKQTNPEK